MKCCITGTSRGVGKEFFTYFLNKGWEVISFDRSNSIEDIVSLSQDCDLFINNAYNKDLQLELVKRLSDKKMVICGSVVVDYPDDQMPEYTKYKTELEDYFKQHIDNNMLLLRISGYSYNQPTVLINAIEFWLANPSVRVISFVPGEPNR